MYDYIIVGAGSSGCVLANRLSENPDVRVLLLEAGGPDDNPGIHNPNTLLSELPNAADVDWAYLLDPQSHCNNRQIVWPRGKLLGGSSSLNAMIYVRGHTSDFDNWAYQGNPGWDFKATLPYFRKPEDFDGGESEYRAVGGPLHILSKFEKHPLAVATVEAAQKLGYPFTGDVNGAEMAGVGYAQLTIKEGKRHSAAVAFLRPALSRPNLTAIPHARTHRLLFANNRCTGVEYEHEGALHQARAASETILAAGTLESPRLLMLSGIGPAAHLRQLGIVPKIDLPGVGQNLHDHTFLPTVFASKRAVPPLGPGVANTHAQMFWYTDERLPGPDLQVVFSHRPAYRPGMNGPAQAFSLVIGHVRPLSRGSLRLGSTDIQAPMRIDPNYLGEAHDLRALEAAIYLCRDLAAGMNDWYDGELYPGPLGRADLHNYIRATVGTFHHQVGACKMGVDSLAVVDPALRVYGVDGLRVVDASIMPAVTSGNTNAPTIMIAEKAADMIKGVRN